MPKYIPPFKPNNYQVKPIEPGDFNFRSVPTATQQLFDRVAHEHLKISGTPIRFYSKNLDDTNVDPLYGETIEPVWQGPYELIGWMEWPDPSSDTRMEGFRSTVSIIGWIPRLEFDISNAPDPKPGDVLAIWNLPLFDKGGVADEKVPGSMYAFNVTNVNDHGHMFDNPYFVGYRFDLTRNTEFTPERRITPP